MRFSSFDATFDLARAALISPPATISSRTRASTSVIVLIYAVLVQDPNYSPTLRKKILGRAGRDRMEKHRLLLSPLWHLLWLILWQAAGSSALRSRIIGPIGPFTPFRSEFCRDSSIDREMQQLTEQAAEIGRRFGAMSIGMTSGNPPEPAAISALADDLEAANEGWNIGLTRLQLADDFQAQQFFKLVEAQMELNDMSFSDMKDVMAFQIHVMRAFAAGTMATMSPPSSVVKMQEQQMRQQDANGGMGMGGGMPSLQMDGTGAWPFIPDHEALKSQIVAAELESLTRDNRQLVKMGAAYRTFDRVGKGYYIDQVLAVEDRWRTFIGRFELMGALSEEFIDQQDSYLRGLQIGEVEDFENLLSRAREIMREDAERVG